MKKVLKITIFVVLYFISIPVKSQNQAKIDSLLALLPTDNDSLASTIYRDIRVEYHYIDFEKSEFYAKKEFEYAKKTNSQSLIQKATVNVGNHYAAAGDEMNTAKWYQVAIDGHDKQTEGPQIASILNTWGIVFCTKGYYDKGMIKFQEALDMVNLKWPDAPIKGECLLSLGMLHGSLKNYEASDAYLEQAISFFKKNKNESLLYETITMLAFNQFENNKNELAKENFLEGINYFEKSNDLFNLSKTCSSLGAVFLNQDSLNQAEHYFEKGLEIAKEIKRVHLQAIIFQSLGELSFKRKQYAKSIDYIKQSHPLSIQLEDIRAQEKDHSFLAEIYEKTGNYKLAYGHLKDQFTLRDSILSEDKIFHMDEMEKKYESERKKQEIILLEEKAKRDSLEKKGLIGGLIGLVSLVGFLFYAMNLRKKKNQLAKEKIDQKLAFKTKELDIKKQELTSKVLQLCRKNEFLKTLEKQVSTLKLELKGKEKTQVDKLSRQIKRDIEADSDWEQFLKSFESIHPNFNDKLNRVHPEFTVGEIRLTYLLKMNLGTKEIASLLNITAEGVKKARQRMRKKMSINSSVNLNEYFLNFENKYTVNN